MPEITPGPPAGLRSHRSTDARRWTPRHFGDELSDRHEEKRREKQEKARRKKGARGAADPAPAADLVPDEAEEPAPNGGEPVACACGRLVPAYALVDVRGLDPAVRGAQEWACDGCWTSWIRAGRLARHDWLTALGAPEELVEAHRRHGHPFRP